MGADTVFDAPDRDTIPDPTAVRFGLGVDNTLISNGMPGVRSQPSEIGYYANSAICGVGTSLADKCADQLGVTLNKALFGGSFAVTFFYGLEQSGETLKVELLRNGVLQDSPVYGPAVTGSYDGTNPGLVSFDLENVYWDEIRFIGDSTNVADLGLPGGVHLRRPHARARRRQRHRFPSTKISSKGNWFMFNSYPGDVCWGELL